MRSFDASSTAADIVPVDVLARLDDLIGDYALAPRSDQLEALAAGIVSG